MAEPPTETDWLKVSLILALLTAGYFMGAYLCSALTASAGVGWVHHLAESWNLSPHERWATLSLLNTVELAVIAIPVGGIIARLLPRQALWVALAVAVPACWLYARDIWTLWTNPWMIKAMGMEVSNVRRGIMLFDATKVLLLPAIFTAIVPHLLPKRS